MNRRLVFILPLLFSLGIVTSEAQNIISNPGFEEYTKKPSKTSQWNLVKGWGAIDIGSIESPNTPDLYSLKGGSSVRLPHPSWIEKMSLYPKEGNAVAGFIALSNIGLHEYITATLTRKITKGERVQCSFYYTNGGNFTPGKNKARIGVYFSSSFPVSSTQRLQVTPQVQMSSPQFSNDWVLYEVDFTAQEDYAFMTIGCFDDPYDRATYDKATDNGFFGDWAYYFIDGVSVTTDADPKVETVTPPVVTIAEKEKPKEDAKGIRFIFETDDTKEKLKVAGEVFNNALDNPSAFTGMEVIVSPGQSNDIRVVANASGYFPLNETISRDSLLKTETRTHVFYLSPVKKGSTIVLKNINFNTGSPVLLPSSYLELDKLVNLLQANPHMEILIVGHTDNLGDPEKDLILSEQRAENVKQYLTEKGIRSNRLSAKGFGITKPIADNKTPLGRAKNRRVEFSILK